MWRVTLVVTLQLILFVVLIKFLNVKAMSLRAVLSLFSSLFLGGLVAQAEASPIFASNERYNAGATDASEQGPFSVPAKLRGRVDFWKDVFAKYGNKQVVVHHRDFPQIVFGVLDFSAEDQTMGPIELDRHMDRVEKQTISEMREQIRALIKGQEPSTAFQKSFVQKMQQLSPEARSYKVLLDEDLIRTQTGIRERYAQAMMRAWRYLPTMEQIFVSEYGLPKELTIIRRTVMSEPREYGSSCLVLPARTEWLLDDTWTSVGIRLKRLVRPLNIFAPPINRSAHGLSLLPHTITV